MGLTNKIAHMICTMDADAVPADVRTYAAGRVLDTVGAALAGYLSWEHADKLLRSFAPDAEGCTCIAGAGRRYRYHDAAVIGSTLAHSAELDDGHKSAGVHAGAIVVPTALALAQKTGATGREVLAAVIAGYETVYRITAPVGAKLIKNGFHPSALCDTFGAAAVASKLLKLTEEQTRNALALAAMFTGGLFGAVSGAPAIKCVMVGRAAGSGIRAAELAAAGMAAEKDLLTGGTGFFSVFAGEPEVDIFLENERGRWLITDTYTKMYPTCRHCQTAMDGAVALKNRAGFSCGEISAIDVGTYLVALEVVGQTARPQNAAQAKFNAAYCLAASLCDGQFGLRHLEEGLAREDIASLARKVTVRLDDEMQALYPGKRGSRVTFVLKDGSHHEEVCFSPLGSPDNPVGQRELVRKFTDIAGMVMPQTEAETLAGFLTGLDGLKDVSEPARLMSLVPRKSGRRG